MEKYMNVMIEVESLIEGGTFQEGARLPSIRQLAERFHVSKSTVIRALQELEKRHIIYAVPKSGYYLIKNEKSRSENKQVSLILQPRRHPDIFPYRDFQHCINKAIDMYKNDLFIYGTPQGLPSLIRVLQRLLSDYQVFAKERNIFITSGVQQALSLLSLMPFPNGKRRF